MGDSVFNRTGLLQKEKIKDLTTTKHTQPAPLPFTPADCHRSDSSLKTRVNLSMKCATLNVRIAKRKIWEKEPLYGKYFKKLCKCAQFTAY